MSTTKIEWATKVWNPVTGCTKVSEGCQNCYAERFAKRLQKNPKAGSKYKNGFKPTFHEDELIKPMEWKKPERIFVCSMGDLFHEDIAFEFIYFVFMVMNDLDRHTFMVLTKRPQRMQEFYNWHSETFGIPWCAKPNVWLGISAENQTTFQERFEILSRIPAAIRFVSFEPLLGPIDIKPIFKNKIDWAIAGGETGPKARPCNPNWVTSLINQCHASKTPFFFKGHMFYGNVYNQFPTTR